METTAKQLTALSRLFSSGVIRDMAVKGRSALFARLLRELDGVVQTLSYAPVRDVFESAFDLLRQGGLRDEYVYKAALTHRVLMGRHSLRTACMLSEFRTGDCKADIVILNGTTTVYEIKSERDSLSRLKRQIASYREVFAKVFVIAGERHVDAVLRETASDVGVMALDSRYYISTRREALEAPERVSPLAIFDTLRTEEAKVVLRTLSIAVPDAPNTRMRQEMRRRFEGLSPKLVHNAMLLTMKQTRDMRPLASLVDRVPRSLQAAALSVPLRKSDHDRLVATLDVPLREARAWS